MQSKFLAPQGESGSGEFPSVVWYSAGGEIYVVPAFPICFNVSFSNSSNVYESLNQFPYFFQRKFPVSPWKEINSVPPSQILCSFLIELFSLFIIIFCSFIFQILDPYQIYHLQGFFFFFFSFSVNFLFSFLILSFEAQHF